MIDRPSNAFALLDDNDVEKTIFEKVHQKEHSNMDDLILNRGRVDKMLQIF